MRRFFEAIKFRVSRCWEYVRQGMERRSLERKSESDVRYLSQLTDYGSRQGSFNDLVNQCEKIRAAMTEDDRVQEWALFREQHLKPLRTYIIAFRKIHLSGGDSVPPTLWTSYSKMHAHFKDRLSLVYEQHHKNDAIALDSFEDELNAIDPAARVDKPGAADLKKLRKQLKRLRKEIQSLAPLLHSYGFKPPAIDSDWTVISADSHKLIVEIQEIIDRIVQSFSVTEDWTALEPCIHSYLEPYKRMLTKYILLQQRRPAVANESLLAVDTKLLAGFKQKLSAFHEQLYAHQITQLETAAVELATGESLPHALPAEAALAVLEAELK